MNTVAGTFPDQLDAQALYAQIYFVREFELLLDGLFAKGLVHGTAHFCIGQEFIPAIVSMFLGKNDAVTSTHRGHGHALCKGLDPTRYLAEIIGLPRGYNKGKGGSQHVMSVEDNYYANGITGGMMPVVTGMGFARKYASCFSDAIAKQQLDADSHSFLLSDSSIAVGYMGDGAINEGHTQEALHMAQLYQVPVLFICENNNYAMSTSVASSHAAPIVDRVKGLGIRTHCVMNNDYEKLFRLVKEEVARIRKGEGPAFIEIQTYRHKGHSKNDQNLYRTDEEETNWFGTDVLVQLEAKLDADSVRLLKQKADSQIATIKEELEL